MRIFGLVVVMLLSNRLWAQTCSTLGQNPSTAFPVCGATSFSQTNVPICSTHTLAIPGCPGSRTVSYADKNPFWYRFTCYQTGTLAFLITPKDLGDDYDWMLYDITGLSPDEVFTNTSLIVTGNWAGTFGVTGASAAGVNFIQCASDPVDHKNSFSTMPTLQQGHQYLLLVSHFSPGQSGYDLSFGGGTAVITDPLLPKMQESRAGCGGVTVTIKMNKGMKCSSLAANGSDFSLSSNLATIVSATGIGCSNSFDMDTVVLTMSNALPPGSYTITIKNGTDGNTLQDNCNNSIPAGDNIAFTVFPVQPTPMDSIKPVACAPNTLQLVFRKPIACNSIAANGSDFIVTGTTPITITGASGHCSNGVTSTINVQLSAPIQTAGNYQIQLKKGNDGNTIIDECGQETPPGAALPFATKDTVNADFKTQLLYGCTADTINCYYTPNNGVNQWNWKVNSTTSSTLQNPSFVFSDYDLKQIQHIVSNGVCKDTSVINVMPDNYMKAQFFYPDILCPQENAVFTDSSAGNIISWNWNFGNGSTSMLQNPLPQTYSPLTNERSKIYTVQLIVENNIHCFDTITHPLKVVNSCYITLPNAFTPNSDGKNDYLYPLNAWKATNLELFIYNRYGQVVFHTTDWTRKWDGTINGQLQSSGVYAWSLRYTDRETGEKFFKRGTTVLIR